jgi:ActR/RegA family two-component response regulator
MSVTSKKLLAVIEFIEHAQYPVIYKALGFDVTTEWQVRKAVTLIRKMKPDVIVADFYFQSDFRDRLSNLESLLAATQLLADTRVLVFYEPQNQSALDRVQKRMRIDAALPMPANEDAIKAVLRDWL